MNKTQKRNLKLNWQPLKKVFYVNNQLFKQKLTTREDGVNNQFENLTWTDITIVEWEGLLTLSSTISFSKKSLTQEKSEPSKQFEDLGKSSQQSTILGRCPRKAATNLPWQSALNYERESETTTSCLKIADTTCQCDPKNASRNVLQDFRSGRWGPMSLQLAPESQQYQGQAHVLITTGTTKRWGENVCLGGRATMAHGPGIKAGGRTGITFSSNVISAPLIVSTKTNNLDCSQDVGRGQFDGC